VVCPGPYQRSWRRFFGPIVYYVTQLLSGGVMILLSITSVKTGLCARSGHEKVPRVCVLHLATVPVSTVLRVERLFARGNRKLRQRKSVKQVHMMRLRAMQYLSFYIRFTLLFVVTFRYTLVVDTLLTRGVYQSRVERVTESKAWRHR